MSSEITASLVPQPTENSGAITVDAGNKASELPVADEPEVEIEKPKTQDRFAPKFAALSRKEKALKEQELAFKSQQDAWAKERAEFEAEKAKWTGKESDITQRLKSRPFDVLKEVADLDYEKLTDMQLNDQNPTVEMKMAKMQADLESKYEAKIAEMNERLEARDKSQKEAEEAAAKAQYDTAVEQYKESLKNVINANTDLELVQMHEAHDLVFDVVEEYFNKTGTVLDPLVAAKHVESELEEEANKVMQAKKFQGKLAPKAPEAKAPAQTKQSATLTNNQSSETPVNGNRKLTREESIAELAKTLKFHK